MMIKLLSHLSYVAVTSPDVEASVAFYEKHAATKSVLVLQGHPEQWNDERWSGFTKIIDFLKSKNVVFMTPSEYLKKPSTH